MRGGHLDLSPDAEGAGGRPEVEANRSKPQSG